MSTLTNGWYGWAEGILAKSLKYTRFAHSTSYQNKLEKKVVLLRRQLGGHTAKSCRLSLHISNLSTSLKDDRV